MVAFWKRSAGRADAVSAGGLEQELAAGARVALLDVREPEEHAEWRIPGSLLIPLGDLGARLGELDPQRETVVYCRSGRRSALACAWLRRAGFQRVRNLTGGILAWRGEVERGA
ncbi:MAG: rhodanese-like domain-containing protein [Armatimonadetes bacterium]|nr:rhodanese-like domain-containing protein [Armatimonadota bacterium]